jgi:predicted nucleic acid-binding protein
MLALDKKVEGFVSALSLKDIFYMYSKKYGVERAFDSIGKMAFSFEILDIASSDSIDALCSDFTDYEDALLMVSAKRNGIDAIITRDKHGFDESDVAVFHPDNIDQCISSDLKI